MATSCVTVIKVLLIIIRVACNACWNVLRVGINILYPPEL